MLPDWPLLDSDGETLVALLERLDDGPRVSKYIGLTDVALEQRWGSLWL